MTKQRVVLKKPWWVVSSRQGSSLDNNYYYWSSHSCARQQHDAGKTNVVCFLPFLSVRNMWHKVVSGSFWHCPGTLRSGDIETRWNGRSVENSLRTITKFKRDYLFIIPNNDCVISGMGLASSLSRMSRSRSTSRSKVVDDWNPIPPGTLMTGHFRGCSWRKAA